MEDSQTDTFIKLAIKQISGKSVAIITVNNVIPKCKSSQHMICKLTKLDLMPLNIAFCLEQRRVQLEAFRLFTMVPF